MIKVIKRESRIGVDIYYIGYVFDSEYETHSVKPLYLVINNLFGHIEKIEGSSDRYLVANINNKKIINIFDEIWKYIEQRITTDGIWKFVEEKFIFDNENNKIKEYNKLRFSSNLDLPLDTLIEFRALTLTILYTLINKLIIKPFFISIMWRFFCKIEIIIIKNSTAKRILIKVFIRLNFILRTSSLIITIKKTINSNMLIMIIISCRISNRIKYH